MLKRETILLHGIVEFILKSTSIREKKKDNNYDKLSLCIRHLDEPSCAVCLCNFGWEIAVHVQTCLHIR